MAEILRPTVFARATPENVIGAAEALKAGGLVAMPTETVYGLAGLATSDVAVAAIYAAKGRPRFNPLIAHFAETTTRSKKRFSTRGRKNSPRPFGRARSPSSRLRQERGWRCWPARGSIRWRCAFPRTRWRGR